jgi:hypothetical protein
MAFAYRVALSVVVATVVVWVLQRLDLEIGQTWWIAYILAMAIYFASFISVTYASKLFSKLEP